MDAIEPIAFLIIFMSMLIRTLFGFGSALISVPLLSILFGAKFAVPFIMLYECLIDLLMILKMRAGIKVDMNRASILFIFGLIGIPLGTEVLIMSSEKLLRITMGITLILSAIILLWNFSFKIKRERAGFAFSGLVSGFLCGSIGLPGPPMALFLSSQGFSKEEFRRLIVIFLTIIDFLTFIYFIWIGLISREMLFQNLLLVPAVFLGFVLGNIAFTRCNENYFRKLVLVIIIASGTVLLITAL